MKKIFLILFFLLMISPVSALIKSESLENGAGTTSAWADDFWLAQTFTIGETSSGENITIKNVSLKFGTTGSPEGIVVSIRNVNASKQPTGSDLVSYTRNFTGSEDWYNFSLTNYVLRTGTSYALILRAPNGDNSNRVDWVKNETAGAYPNMNASTSEDGGTTWTDAGNKDYLFQIWGEEKILVNNVTYNETVYETKNYGNLFFSVNVSSDYFNITNATLNYDGTSYYVSNTTNDNYAYFYKEDINKTFNSTDVGFFWNFTLVNSTDTIYYDLLDSQIPSLLVFGLCNSTLTTPFLNISFKDETNLSILNGKIPSSTFYFWIDDASVNKTYSFVNNTENLNYQFCAFPNETINLQSYVQYSSTNYPQRIYNPSSSEEITNSLVSKIFYLLSSTDGIYVTFQIVNSAEQPIEDVIVNATREIDGIDTLLDSGITGAAGSVTFWLNSDFSHTFTFFKLGYDILIESLKPTQTEYTITLGGGGGESPPDYLQGISYFIRPSIDYLDNSTEYEFNYTLSSSYWELDEFGFYLYYGNGTLIDSNISTSNGGFLNLIEINTTELQSSIYMDYYYLVNSTYINGTRTWRIQPTYGRSFSIWNFFENLDTYLSAGLYGFDNFGKVLLSVVILILITGGLSVRYGIVSDAAIMGILFGLVLLLDYGLGFIPQISIGGLTAIPYFPTALTFIILIALIIKEERT